MSETPGLSFACLGGLGNGGWRGALQVAQRQAPLRGEGLCEGGGGLPAEAGVGAFGVVVLARGRERGATPDMQPFLAVDAEQALVVDLMPRAT